MSIGLRIYSLTPESAATESEPPPAWEAIAAMGFDTVHLAGATTEWGGAATDAGLRLMTDVVPDRPLAPQFTEAIRQGVRAFRCRAAHAISRSDWRSVLRAARREAPDSLFCADALGRPVQDLWALEGAGFDFLFSSVAWWNGRDPWFLEQAPIFQRVAPSVGFPLFHSGETTAERERKYLMAAALSSALFVRRGYEQPGDEGGDELRAFIAETNRLKTLFPTLAREGRIQPAGPGPASPIVSLVRSEESGKTAAILLVNTGAAPAETSLDVSLLALDGFPAGGYEIAEATPGQARAKTVPPRLRVESGAARLFLVRARESWSETPGPLPAPGAPPPRIIIEAIQPEVDGGRFPVKRIVGDTLVVTADIFRDGHDLIKAVLKVRPPGEPDWSVSPLRPVGNDRWEGRVELRSAGRTQYAIEAWTDAFGSWREALLTKRAAGQSLVLELAEGRRIAETAARRAAGPLQARLKARLATFDQLPGDEMTRADYLSSAVLLAELAQTPPAPDRVVSAERPLTVDRPQARFSSWYEMFPRSQGREPDRPATFLDCERRLPEIAALGFDVVYLVPIHPIGERNRKGRNNQPHAEPGDPGSPYAIGNRHGGHTAVDPALGSLDDFRHFQREVRAHGMELALDFAVQCAPDHPWVKEHAAWFRRRPDGSIQFAENPPKKYEDIVNLDFDQPDWRALWEALLEAVRFWMGEGVRIFRVDNPHTKPARFWEWLIGEAQASDPGVLFLAEAFTRPKMMRHLAKAGFTQSYTYFTWRNTKSELTDYLTELTRTEAAEYFRPNFFPNTPDILPSFLQVGGRAAFRIRLVLAATLSGNYGIYNGFELCEARALPGREEYADSEKYALKVWDWDRPGHIKTDIAQLNALRHACPALQRLDNLRFHESSHDAVLFYGRTGPGGERVFVAVTLDPFHPVETEIVFPLADMGLGGEADFATDELFSGWRQVWRGARHTIVLNPAAQPALVWSLL